MTNLVEITIRTNDETDFAAILAKAEALKKALSGSSLLGFDPQKVDSELSALKAKLQSHGIADLLDLNLSQGQIAQQLALLRRKVNDARIGDLLDVNLNEGQIERQLADIRFTPEFMNGIDLSRLVPRGETVPIRVTDPGVQEAAADLGDLTAAEHDAAAAAEVLGAASQDTARKQGLFNDAISLGLPLWQAAGGRFGFLQSHLQLFGGALTQIGIPAFLATASGLHLVAEAVIETAGTLIPAAIAFGTFGVAAASTVKDLYQQMSSLYNASQALGVQMPGLSGGFSAMEQAVQPQVYELFGEALYVAGHNTGAFTTLATGAGKALDDLGARLSYALTQGNGFNTFTHNAANDLAGWGNLIGNIGGIMANVFKVLPGYAEDILSVANSLTHMAEVVTGSGIGQGILSIGLAAHGALLYIGLLGTAFAKLAQVSLAGIATGLANAAVGISEIGAAGAVAGDGLMAVAAGAEGAAGLPWGWIALAAAALGVFAYQMGQAKDQTQQFYASAQSAIQAAKLGNLTATMQAAQAQSAAELAKDNRTLTASADAYTASLKAGVPVMNLHTGELTQQQAALADASRQQQEAVGGNNAINASAALVNTRMAALSKTYGGTASALAALTGAGITSAQITSTNAQTWGEALIEIQAYQAAIKETTLQDGRLGAAQNALNYTAGDSANQLGQMDSAIQGVTQAQTQMLGVLTGGSTALDSFQQGIATLATNFQQATGTGGTVNETLGNLKNSASLAGAAIGGTTAASYALNQAFYSQVQSAQGVISALEMQNATTDDVTKATATVAGQMLGFAGSNTAARSALVDLINGALGPGTVSLQTLNKWIGNNSTSLGGLNSIIAKAQIQASAFAGVLQQDVVAALGATVFQASGAQGAMTRFANAIQNTGNASAATRGARAVLIADLMNAGYSAQQAARLANQLQASIDRMHGKNVNITANGSQAARVIATIQGEVNGMHGTTIPVTVSYSTVGSSGVVNAYPYKAQAMGGIAGIVPHAAAGGVQNGMTLVGELGPELVSLPVNSRVWPHGVTPPGMQGGGTAAASQPVILEITSTGQQAFDALMLKWVREHARIKGGGDVQRAFGVN